MTKNKFIELLKRNFGEKDTVNFAVNKKFYIERKVKEDPDSPERFSREFSQSKHYVKNIGSQVVALKDKYDLYLSFTPTDGERKKPNAQDSYIIAQDIDGAPIPTDLPPSYYWETSPNKYQGVWVLDNKVNPQEHEILCRKLVAKYGFDPCGVDIVHLYRIPGSINHKYASDFKVSGLQGEGTVYRKRDFVKFLEDIDITKNAIVENEEIKTISANLDDILEEYNAFREFSHKLAVDRSEWAWKLESKLIRNGASKEIVKFVLLNAPYDKAKFTEETIDAEVNRAFAKMSEDSEDEEKSPVKLKTKLDKQIELEDIEAKSLNKTMSQKGKKHKSKFNIVRVDEIQPFDPTDFWLIEDLWENGSVGVIGAPSKSFKSTLALNLACAVATGKPFDGRKVKQGAVLIIQGENNLSMEQHKIYAITGSETPPPIYYVEDNITMEQVYKLENDIRELGVKLLIIDPMYLLFGNGDINKHQDIVERLEMLTRISKKAGCAVMLIHHSRKLEIGAKIQTSDMYGSTFIEGWYESMILLQRKSNNSSVMTTYFRNHKSGDVYDLVVDDNMGCRVFSRKGESAYESPTVDLSVLKEKEE